MTNKERGTNPACIPPAIPGWVWWSNLPAFDEFTNKEADENYWIDHVSKRFNIPREAVLITPGVQHFAFACYVAHEFEAEVNAALHHIREMMKALGDLDA